ncbi:hypothetical protein Clacol_009381 [Clathrus columnatus]|uniref:DUF6533 domain-containing protein n=1 Tax=Clathrus columnatus TaxID=1419009 RepID=A0AAV5AKB7_9AGAM|nr:hypothetical protein Clacol_009381 [Clathrus columnatus]
MDNQTLSSLINEIIYDYYLTTVQLDFTFGALALLIYASFLSLSDEVEHIWEPKFTLPTYLYLLTKYPLFIFLPLAAVVDLAPISLGQCNDVSISAQVSQILSFIGIQGLVSIRAYSLCQGYRPMAVALSITFLTALIVQFYGPLATRLFLIQIVAIILSDTLASIAVIRQVWGVWRLKRSLGLQGNDFLTLLLQQGLRRRNKKVPAPNPTALSLPTLSFQDNPVQTARSVLGRLHENIVAEMGERNDPLAMDPNGSRESIISSLLGSANSNEGPRDEDQLEEDVGHRLVVGNDMV